MVLQHQTQQQLRSDNESLRQQIAQLKSESDDAANHVVTNNSSQNEQLSELLRLRGEVTALRGQTNQLARLSDENQKMREALTKIAQQQPPPADPVAEQQQAFAMQEMNTAKLSVLGMMVYAGDHRDQFPTNFDLITQYVDGGTNSSEVLSNLSRFQIVYQGSESNVVSPASTIVVREMQPWLRNGQWHKAYGFADGHVETHTEATGNFDEWEQQHVTAPNNQ
jgi:hypothetical protein